ncbi:MAG: glycosyltransferase [Planctomycetota bacterium]
MSGERRRIRIVNYAVNGRGVGHLTRLVAINRWLRRYAAYCGARAEVYFLTSSEADGLLFQEGFASFKLPSKTVVKETGIPKLAYLALAKQWVWHSLGLLRPDLLVVDTFPRGSFGELLSALDLAHHKAFIYRPLKASYAARPDFQAMLPLYDAILVPDHAEHAASFAPERVRDRVEHVGPVVCRERVELQGRAEARRALGVPDERLCVYLSAGGGGDPSSEDALSNALAALADDPGLHLVVGAGPLYRGRRQHGPRITWLGHQRAIELMPGFDLALSAGGYNSFFELLYVGVPTVFLPQPKVADEQDVRVARAVAAGAARQLPPGAGPSEVRAALDALRDPAAREALTAAARALVPRNHARAAAAELLRLVLPPAAVEAAEEAVDDELLAAARELGLELQAFFELMEVTDPRPRETLDAEAAQEASRLATGLLREVARLGVPLPAARRVLDPLARKLGGAAPRARAAALRAALAAFLPFADWSGAAMVVRALRGEKELEPAALLEALERFLAGLRAAGLDLYAGLARLAAAQGDDEEVPTNRELLERAAARTGAGAGASTGTGAGASA